MLRSAYTRCAAETRESSKPAREMASQGLKAVHLANQGCEMRPLSSINGEAIGIRDKQKESGYMVSSMSTSPGSFKMQATPTLDVHSPTSSTENCCNYSCWDGFTDSLETHRFSTECMHGCTPPCKVSDGFNNGGNSFATDETVFSCDERPPDVFGQSEKALSPRVVRVVETTEASDAVSSDISPTCYDSSSDCTVSKLATGRDRSTSDEDSSSSSDSPTGDGAYGYKSSGKNADSRLAKIEVDGTDVSGDDNRCVQRSICNKPFRHVSHLTLENWSETEDNTIKPCIDLQRLPLAMQSGYELRGGHLVSWSSVPKTGSSTESNVEWSATEMHNLLETVASAIVSTEYVLNSLVERITPTRTCRANKLYLFNVLKRFIKYCLGDDAHVYIAGSTANDIDIDYCNLLSVPFYSDLDIDVILSRYGSNAMTILRQIFHNLCESQAVLKGAGMVSNWTIGRSAFKLVDSARVPIIIIRTKNGMLCDVSVNAANSLKHNKLFHEYIEKYPIMRSLMRLIKHWLKFRGIPATKEGGFPTILWMFLFCNAFDIGETYQIGNASRARNVSAMCEMLLSRNILRGDVASVPLSHISLLAALEKTFRTLAEGNNLIEMVNAATAHGRVQDASNRNIPTRWSMGEIGRKLVELIEVEPYVPFATWLVYYYEICRTEEGLSKYMECIETLVSLSICLRVYETLDDPENSKAMAEIRALIIQVKHVFGYNLFYLLHESRPVLENVQRYVQRTAHMLRITPDSSDMMESTRMLINHVSEQLSSIVTGVFYESYDKVYSIPASIEPPTPIMPKAQRDIHDPLCSPQSSDGGIWSDTGWLIVAMEGKLHIVKAFKVCVKWDSWWSTYFVSRRDTKAVFHGFTYRQVSVAGRGDRKPDNELPRVLIRQGALELFHPCDIVSRLYVVKVMKGEQSVSSHYYSLDMFSGTKTLYVLPGFEVARFEQLSRVCARLLANAGPDAFRTIPRPDRCHHCGAITVTGRFVPNELKISQRKRKNLRHLLICPRYNEYYRHMQASLWRVERSIRRQPI
ncbi:erythrocyte membrane-associated antigen, putative [Babesia ovata]|uniref:Erythrocyte membrane-associated antigen, putative n=1 Tax=Babesia ovata TaxID=189622 RepID=A0A2H6K9X8_9APIC|nr:erythrocyte membrane-associated antigen, putative [Babesia ovata]GBE59804.1 erythrocyte membrane-associated antigen, putative [Babesia ovata]